MRILGTRSLTLFALVAAVMVTGCSATPSGPVSPGQVAKAIAAATAGSAPLPSASADPGSGDADASSDDSGTGSDDLFPPADVTPVPQTGPSLAAGPVMAGTNMPVPQGLDCSKSNTVSDGQGNLICGGHVAEPAAVYDYFLQALPKAGFTINSADLETSTDGATGHIYFGGGKFKGFDAITFVNRDVTIELMPS